jgi:hypothetical protein
MLMLAWHGTHGYLWHLCGRNFRRFESEPTGKPAIYTDVRGRIRITAEPRCFEWSPEGRCSVSGRVVLSDRDRRRLCAFAVGMLYISFEECCSRRNQPLR